MTERFKDLISCRQKALKRGHLTEYRALRNKVNRLNKTLRSAFYQTQVHELSSGSNKWWNNMNKLMGRKQVGNPMQKLANEHTDGDILLLANKLNVFFKSVSEDLPKL